MAIKTLFQVCQNHIWDYIDSRSPWAQKTTNYKNHVQEEEGASDKVLWR